MRSYARTYQFMNRAVAQLSHRPMLANLMKNCFPNTLETTIQDDSDGSVFVVTGDIPAMWLRDSSAQVSPYIRLVPQDPDVRDVVARLIQRHAKYILHDAYANAFNQQPNAHGHQNDETFASPLVWERKFELDSLCYPVQLCADYIQSTGDLSVLTATVHAAFRQIVSVMRTEQRHDRESPYQFVRPKAHRYLPTDSLPHQGRGTPTNYTGMVWSGFRPSDDACTFGYLIPSNMFAVQALAHIERFARDPLNDVSLAEEAERLREEIQFGIETYGTVMHPKYGRIYAYETDGFGNYTLMDDSNVPSLLSIPYLGYKPADDACYLRTRAFILSSDNPTYVIGQKARGVGSPHTPPGYIWPMSLIMQGLTSVDPAEVAAVINLLESTTGGTDFMHESFDANNPSDFTRPWFAWANSLFGELVAKWLGLTDVEEEGVPSGRTFES